MTATPAPRRSDATRAAILAAARERFGRDGYERSTIRAIATDARIDPAMVMRYFGSKEGLFAAAAEFDLRLPDWRGVPRGELGTRTLRHVLERWEDDGSLSALLRAGVTNESAAGRMREVFAAQVVPAVAAVVADPAEVHTRAGLVAAQVLGVVLTRYVLRLPPVADLGREEVVAWIGPTVQRYLTGPLPAAR